jgi:hypothetical protein
MPSRGRMKLGESEPERPIDDGVSSLLHARLERPQDSVPADYGHIPAAAEADALASRRCAARVADALKKIGYGFAVIPSTARPRRK